MLRTHTARRLAALLVTACVSTLAAATSQRTFVSAAGVDNVNCSLASPCRSFATAITATNAGGEVIVLDSAGYGPVIITKSVSLIAPAGVYAGISVFSGDGVTVNAPAATVVLRGISINGQGGTFGVRLQAAARLRIENCVISNMSGNAIQLTLAGAETIVINTSIRVNASGIAVLATGRIVLDHVRIEQNTAHGIIMSAPPNSAPMRVTISDSHFSANGQDGINANPATNSTVGMQVERSIISHNGGVGLNATSGGLSAQVNVTLTRSAISHNQGTGVLISAVLPDNIAFGSLSENALEGNGGDGILADGSGAFVMASANTIQGGPASMRCVNNSVLNTLANNAVFNVLSSGNCYHTGPGA